MQELYTKKIYYKIYTHRVAIACGNPHAHPKSKDYDPCAPNGAVITWLLNNKFGVKAYKGLSSYSYVESKNTYTVFFKDTEVLDYLQQQLGTKYFVQLEKPMDNSHVEMLEANDKLVTRKQLFYGKYRMCLRVSPEKLSAWQTSTQNITEIKKWCKEQFGDERQNLGRYLMSGWSKGNFYFADVKDALLFKLTWGGQDVRTERVVTYAELEEAKA